MGYVYLLGDWEKEGFFKIGVTRGDVERRIKKLQTGNGGEIYMVTKFETEHPFFLEKNLHLAYGHKKILNEWFSLTNEEVLGFKDKCGEIEEMKRSLDDNPFIRKYLK